MSLLHQNAIFGSVLWFQISNRSIAIPHRDSVKGNLTGRVTRFQEIRNNETGTQLSVLSLRLWVTVGWLAVGGFNTMGLVLSPIFIAGFRVFLLVLVCYGATLIC